MVVWTVWLCLLSHQNIIKLTPAPASREGGGREAREGGREACTVVAKLL